MRLSRIYYPEALIANSDLTLSADNVNYIVNVLRLRVGDQLVLFHDNKECLATINSINKRAVVVTTAELQSVSRESPVNIHLLQAVARGEKMDWIFQKCTELGVAKFTPILTERCGVKLSAARWQKRLQHWQAVMVSACEQSGRNQVPTLFPVRSFEQAIADEQADLKFCLSPDACQSFCSVNNAENAQTIAIVIGPEGGFSEAEMLYVERQGFTPVLFGPRTLRTETAAIASVALIQSTFGDLVQ